MLYKNPETSDRYQTEKSSRGREKMPNQIPLTVLLCAVFYGFCMAQTVQRWPFPNDCHRYYETRLLDCPPEYYWNSQLLQCDSHTPVGCSSLDPIPNWNYSNPNPPPITDPENSDLSKLCENKLNQLIPYPADCTKFIRCDYMPFVMCCPQYLYWNSKLLTCDKMCV